MSISNKRLVNLRKNRGWSQEKLAAMSGVSERTIQRAEKDGTCSLETKLALANAFDIPPSELTRQMNSSESLGEEKSQEESEEYQIDWGGALGLLVLGLAFPAIILLTGTDGRWEIASFFTVMILTVLMSIMTHGFRATHRLFDKTSWIVRYPKRARGLGDLIFQANQVIKNAYTIGAVTSLVAGLTIAVHNPEMTKSLGFFLSVVAKPLLYALLFVEFWFRPYKRKMESMLRKQNQVNE